MKEFDQVPLSEKAEFRQEIRARSQAQHTLINLNVTASGTVAGLVLAGEDLSPLLLVIPLLSPALGLLYIDHAMNIRELGLHIDALLKEEITPMRANWESIQSRKQRSAFSKTIPLNVPIFIMFWLIPVTALALAFPLLTDREWLFAAWSIGALLVLAWLWVWVVHVVIPYVDDNRSNDTNDSDKAEPRNG